jgi:hypothetical protein
MGCTEFSGGADNTARIVAARNVLRGLYGSHGLPLRCREKCGLELTLS